MFNSQFDANDRWLREIVRTLVRDEHLASDALQEAYLAALASPPRESSSARSWLRRVATNAFLKSRRSESRRRRREAQVAHSESQELFDRLEHRETRRGIRRAIGALPEKQRAVILLHYYEGLSVRGIAERSGSPEATIKSWLQRARANLRESLDEDHRRYRSQWCLSGILTMLACVWRPRRSLCRPEHRAFAGVVALIVTVGVVSQSQWGGRYTGSPRVAERGPALTDSIVGPTKIADVSESASTSAPGSRFAPEIDPAAPLVVADEEIGQQPSLVVLDSSGMPVSGTVLVVRGDPLRLEAPAFVEPGDILHEGGQPVTLDRHVRGPLWVYSPGHSWRRWYPGVDPDVIQLQVGGTVRVTLDRFQEALGLRVAVVPKEAATPSLSGRIGDRTEFELVGVEPGPVEVVVGWPPDYVGKRGVVRCEADILERDSIELRLEYPGTMEPRLHRVRGVIQFEGPEPHFDYMSFKKKGSDSSPPFESRHQMLPRSDLTPDSMGLAWDIALEPGSYEVRLGSIPLEAHFEVDPQQRTSRYVTLRAPKLIPVAIRPEDEDGALVRTPMLLYSHDPANSFGLPNQVSADEQGVFVIATPPGPVLIGSVDGSFQMFNVTETTEFLRLRIGSGTDAIKSAVRVVR